ncbi:hypothetical protein ES288_D11G399000v1 [Gossypium darwinii]|uniref:Uncharacterized protein n=1 Tax=Gossypium darwinii TaxID=34276 RepID=A0A5D2ATA4_GOSDA|nr:hypothetical protein ES288_D11G399000v1 [Gossypium darwinii]
MPTVKPPRPALGTRTTCVVRGDVLRRSRSCCAWGEGQLLRQRRLLKGFRNPKFLGYSSKSG